MSGRLTQSQRDRVTAVLEGLDAGITGWARAKCPICEERTGAPDKRGALALKVSSGWWVCHKCKARGRLDGEWEETEPKEENFAYDGKLPWGFVELYGAAALKEPAHTILAARQYVHGRGMSVNAAKTAKVGVCLSGEYADQIVVPIFEGSVHLVHGWVARATNPEAPRKYTYPVGMQRGEMFYDPWGVLGHWEESDDQINWSVQSKSTGAVVHADTAKRYVRRAMTGHDFVLVVEGVFDALRHKSAIALLGKPSRWQTEQLASTSGRVIVALDGDAWEEGAALAMRLQLEGVDAVALRLPPCTDPGDFSSTDLNQMITMLG